MLPLLLRQEPRSLRGPASLSGRTRQSLVDDSFASDFDDFFYDYGLNHRFALHCHFLFNNYRLEHWFAGH